MKIIKQKPSRLFDEEFGNKIIGIDEVGLGAFAGPLVVCAVYMDKDFEIDGINDSKKLSAKKREELYAQLITKVDYKLGFGSVSEINQSNILTTTKIAMMKALGELAREYDAVLVDGNKKPANINKLHTIVKGDSKSLAIASASIIAKVTRDKLMKQLGLEFPAYGWDNNMGYGTKAHMDAIIEFGATCHHRINYKPIKALQEEQLSLEL